MRCALCGEKIEETFLGKLKGTYMRIKEKNKNKLVEVCAECQSKHDDKIKEKLDKMPR